MAVDVRLVVALPAAVVLLGAAAPAPPPPALRVRAADGCLDRARAEQQLSRWLRAAAAAHAQSALTLDVGSRATPAGPIVDLHLADRAGRALLTRSYPLAAADCPAAPELLALTLERYVRGLPTAPSATTEQSATPPPSAIDLGLALHAMVSAQLAPVGGDAELGAAAAFTRGPHTGLAGLLGRVTAPRDLGHGRVYDVALLARAGWSYTSRGGWRPQLELRGGAILIGGYGFSESSSGWAAWIEGAVALYRRVGPLFVGVQVAAAPLRHRAFVGDDQTSSYLAPLRIGGGIELPLWQKE